MRMPPLFARPSLWGMAYAAMLAWALYALWVIPTEVLPRFDYPQISLIAHDPGASASEMETLVVRPLEAELLGLQDLVSLRSSMGLGTAELTARFRSGTDPQVDLQAAYGAVDRARGALPPSVSPYAEIMGNAINEVADYGVQIQAGVSPAVVQRAIRTRILPALRALPGVQRIELFGSGEESLWVQPDLLALRRHGVGVDSLATALSDPVSQGGMSHSRTRHGERSRRLPGFVPPAWAQRLTCEHTPFNPSGTLWSKTPPGGKQPLHRCLRSRTSGVARTGTGRSQDFR